VEEAQAHVGDIDIDGELPLAVRRQLRESLAALLPATTAFSLLMGS